MTLLSILNRFLEAIASFLQRVPGLREVIAFLLVFFLPGFCWTLFLFAGKQINNVERVALSFGLSIALVTLAIFAMNRLAGIKITATNAVLIILLLIVIGLILYGVRKALMRDYQKRNHYHSDMKK